MKDARAAAKCAAYLISGVVQGVGFRPYVARLARKHGLTGSVKNAGGGVYIEACGEEAALDAFIRDVRRDPPPGSHITGIDAQAGGLRELSEHHPALQEFLIQPSSETESVAMPAADIAVCTDCLHELFRPGDPRHRNPFISCTYCGPRFSILKSLPYDRDRTSMDRFPMCELCGEQYTDEGDRRYHAQTVCCNACGPRLYGLGRVNRRLTGEEALQGAVSALAEGGIAAIKGIGGYHFACGAKDAGAVRRLRALKGREAKPFAVMFGALAELKAHCEVSPAEEALLTSPARPIVLLTRKASSKIDPGVYGSSRYLGAFLPYTPLQHLLFQTLGPLVMTSANLSGLPILKDDAEAEAFFKAHEGLSFLLGHDRPILRRLDDSVTAVTDGEPQILRRARGYVPLPAAKALGKRPLIACGAHQKSAVCVSNGAYLYPGAELGDLDTLEAGRAFAENAADLPGVLRVTPALAVCDLHPDYASTHYAKNLGLPVLPVQHHFAHIASVMAEHGLTEPVIGVAFDGTGYGGDGTVWGGEFLIASPAGFTRAGHLKAAKFLGTDASVRQGWKSAACLLFDAGLPPADVRGALVHAALREGINVIRSSSMGRVFDAVSALLGVCEESAYEGQCAIELENAAALWAKEAPPLPYAVAEDSGLTVDLAPAVGALMEARAQNRPVQLLARRFHATAAAVIADVCERLREQTGIAAVALSGGVFQNRILLTEATALLRAAGFTVYVNRAVPPGDGGVALGQAYIGGFYEDAAGYDKARGGEGGNGNVYRGSGKID